MTVLPDWNSVESTARWSSILFWVGMSALMVLAATQVASRIFANRSSVLALESGHSVEATPAVSADGLLTDSQKQSLAVAMAPYAGQKISFACNSGDLNADARAREYRAILAKAGWTIEGGDNVQAIVVPAPVGINIYVNREELNARRAPRAAVALAQALLQLGIARGGTITSMNEPDIPPDMIGFFVGTAS
jgi:hypothetical protein